MQKVFYTIFLSILAIIFLPFLASAQAVESDISVEMIPQSPGAFTNVLINLQSYSINLDSSTITWKVDGKVVAASVGIKNYEIRTGPIGSITTIVAEVKNNLNTITKTITIKPSSVDMLWESYSYVPPFYKGKALPGEESEIHVVAIPQMKNNIGAMVKPSDVVYSWNRNDNAVPGASGYSKQDFTFNSSYLHNSQKVVVTASSSIDGTSARGEVSILPNPQKILFYKSTPLYGLDISKTINKGFSLKSGEVTIFAAPYNFSIKDGVDKDLSYKWKINNKIINTPERRNMLTIKPISGQVGVAQIELALESITKLYELATGQMQVTLGQ